MTAGCRTAVLMLLALLTSACGFKLAVDAPLATDFGPVRLVGVDHHPRFARDLTRAMARQGVAVVSDGPARHTLAVRQLDYVQDVVSIGEQARVRELALRLELRFELLDQADQRVGEVQTISLRREYALDETQYIGASGEEEVLRADLEREAVSAVLARLASATPERGP